MENPPFKKSDQLNGQLEYTLGEKKGSLFRTDSETSVLPGQPRVPLLNHPLHHYLSTDLLVPELDKATPWLWLAGIPRNSHISPLHHQAVRGRSITLTENPQLHLVWHHNRIFIKPIPAYLLSFAFWQYLSNQPRELSEAAIGFLRTYAWLLRYESDFTIALAEGLVPKNKFDDSKDSRDGQVTYEDFCRLISSFEGFGDELVAPRYRYGELKLTRLNVYSRIFLRRWKYHHIEAEWATFLGGFFAPFLAALGLLSITFNAMQVELNAIQLELNAMQIGPGSIGIDGFYNSWRVSVDFAKWLSVVALYVIGSFVLLVVAIAVTTFVHDQYLVFRVFRGKRNDMEGKDWKVRESGAV